MKKIRTREKCPVCQLPLEIDLTEANKHIVVKQCPKQHFKKEIHPLLGTTFEYYRSEDETVVKGVGIDV
ncbi:hypothetical protein [Thalassobacillus sp. B23F22_16]|uniref:hypothetical protein n=1 Tax=Thalassobacillus sp. B23F22_16 TaxID=3459513 RepID=UPI00373E182D